MGIVYLAEDGQLHRKVALKILNPVLAQEAIFVESFQREARTLASAYHPHIVHIHSFETIENHTFIDMEFIDGGTLARHIAEGPLAIEPAIRMASEVLGALEWCHAEGLVHRDIKPSNILFDRAGRARVADFGLAGAYAKVVEKAMHESVSTGILWGTPRYAPPEAWDGAPPSPDWDVFAAGVVLYESVTGRPPFDTSNPLTALKGMAQGPEHPVAALAPDAPKWFCDLIHVMLAPEPEERPTTAGEALGRFESTGARSVRPLLDAPVDGEVQPTTPSVNAPQTPATRRRSLFALIASGCALAMLAWVVARPGGLEHAPLSASQAEVFAQAAPTADVIVKLVRDNHRGSWSVFRAEDVDASGNLGSWYIAWGAGGSGEAIVQTETGLWVLDLQPGDGETALAGNWAAYVSPDGSRLDSGVVDGVIHAIEGGKNLLANLRFRSQVDGAQWQRNVLLSEHDDRSTDTAFFAMIEEYALLQPLLYNDLDPAAFPWALRVDAILPALVRSRCTATHVEQPVSIDGVLDEPVWANAARVGSTVAGRPWSRGSELSVGFNDTALLVSVRVPATTDVPRLRLALLPQWLIPATESPRYEVIITADGVAEQRMLQNTPAAAWNGEVSGSLVTSGEWVIAEVAIPFAAMGLDGPPSATERWRLNAVMEDGAGSASARAAEWGWPVWERVEHGLVVSFDAR